MPLKPKLMIKPFSLLPDDWLAPLQRLAEAAEAKLAENQHKGHWREFSTAWLLGRVNEELEEFQKALRAGDIEEIWREAGDVTNFLAMICDNQTRQKEMLDAFVAQVSAGESVEPGDALLVGQQLP